MHYIYCIIGQSGSGKDTIADELEQRFGYTKVKSYTTRPKRNKKENTHIFVSNDEFENIKNKVAEKMFAGYKYCATKEQIEENTIYIIDPSSIDMFAKNSPKPIKVIMISTGLHDRYDRMYERAKAGGLEHIKAVHSTLDRIVNDVIEFQNASKKADIIIPNPSTQDVEVAVLEVFNYINNCENAVINN